MKSPLTALLCVIAVALGGPVPADLSDRGVLSVSLHGRVEAEIAVLKL